MDSDWFSTVFIPSGSSFINSVDDADGVADLRTVLIFILMWLPKRERYVCSIMDKKAASYSSIISWWKSDSVTLIAKEVEKQNYTETQIYSLGN